jgi:hypothetical protein
MPNENRAFPWRGKRTPQTPQGDPDDLFSTANHWKAMSYFIQSTTPAPANLEHLLDGTSCPVIALAVVKHDDLAEPVIEPVYLHVGATRVGRTAHGIGELLTARDAAKRVSDHLGRRLAERQSGRPS